MLSAIRDIGCLVSTKAISGNKRIEGKILAILLNDDNSAFQEISVEDFDVEKINRYLYREGATRGNTPAPIAQITKPDKTCNKKIRKWLTDCEGISGIEGNALEFVRRINQVLKDNEQDIIDSITNKLTNLNLPNRDKKFLTVKLESGNKFLGDYDVFKKGVDYFVNEKAKKSSSSGNVCSVCGDQRDNVSGKTNVFKFYTIDKPGFIAGGFNEPLAWKNFPVCVCVCSSRK